MMRTHTRLYALLLAFVAAGCSDVLGIPSEGQVGCPEPCTVTVSGHTVRADSTSNPQLPLSGVTVTLKNVAGVAPVTTGADGAYSFSGLPPGTPLYFDLSVVQSPDPHGLDTLYVAGTTARSDITLDLPVVQFSWLANVAFQCGIFPTLNDALFNPGTTDPNTYFQARSIVVGQVQDANGMPSKSFDRSDILVALKGATTDMEFDNYQGNADSMATTTGTTICLLETDLDAGQYAGANVEHSTTGSGRFVMFRVRNLTGTGTGTGEVRIPAFPPGPLNLSAGSVGFSKITVGIGTSLPDRIHTFERDVYHWFKDQTCSAVCHKPGGVGFIMAPARVGLDGITYRADWSAAVDMVYSAMTQPPMAGCDTAPPPTDLASSMMNARVCVAQPKASLLYLNPTGQGFHEGITDLTDQSPMIVSVLKWIGDGATLR